MVQTSTWLWTEANRFTVIAPHCEQNNSSPWKGPVYNNMQNRHGNDFIEALHHSAAAAEIFESFYNRLIWAPHSIRRPEKSEIRQMLIYKIRSDCILPQVSLCLKALDFTRLARQVIRRASDVHAPVTLFKTRDWAAREEFNWTRASGRHLLFSGTDRKPRKRLKKRKVQQPRCSRTGLLLLLLRCTAPEAKGKRKGEGARETAIQITSLSLSLSLPLFHGLTWPSSELHQSIHFPWPVSTSRTFAFVNIGNASPVAISPSIKQTRSKNSDQSECACITHNEKCSVRLTLLGLSTQVTRKINCFNSEDVLRPATGTRFSGFSFSKSHLHSIFLYWRKLRRLLARTC